MKITCEKTLLVEAVSNVARAVSAKSPMPALEGVLICTKAAKVALTSYDLEMGIITEIDAKIEQPGQVVLSAKLLLEIIRRIPGETILISSNERQLVEIKGGEAEFTILGIPAEDYPEIPSVEEESNIVLKQGVLKTMIDQTLFAIATTDSKPVHTGSLFDLKNSCLTVVSVDGFRLALRREPLVSDLNATFIVPGKTLSEVSKLLKDEEGEVCLIVSRKHIIFRVGQYYVVSRLLEGDFLDYNAAIPTTSKTTVSVQTRRLTESIERISLLISDRIRTPIKLNFDEAHIQTSCTTTVGKANDALECELDGDCVNMGFNNKYLLDALKAADCDRVRLEINGPLSPMRVTPLDGESFLFLVLPVRVKNDE